MMNFSDVYLFNLDQIPRSLGAQAAMVKFLFCVFAQDGSSAFQGAKFHFADFIFF